MPMPPLAVREGLPEEINPLLRREHYLGPLRSSSLILVAEQDGDVVAGQVWRVTPTSRRLPNDRTWIELSRWCLTSAAGESAGTRFHAAAVRYLRRTLPGVTTLVSYSDPSVGHTGALYRACNWSWAPTWHRLRPPPTGLGQWSTGAPTQAVKDRWVFCLGKDPRRGDVLSVGDRGAMRAWARAISEGRENPATVRWAQKSPSADLAHFAAQIGDAL